MANGKVNTFSFDYKNGGECEKIQDDYYWVESKHQLEGTEGGEDDDDDWIII